MDIQLIKGGNKRTVIAGPSLYLLLFFVPYIGNVALLILTIIKKEFKGVFLNKLILVIIETFLMIVMVLFSIALGSFLLMIISIVLCLLFNIYIDVVLIKNANKYFLAQYLYEGYEIENEDFLSDKTKLWIDENKNIKRNYFLILDF